MPKLVAKQHEIKAFEFKGKTTAYPQWFLDIRTIGWVSITYDCPKEGIDYIALRNKDGDFQKVLKGQWVALNNSKNWFKITAEEIHDSFIMVGDQV